jgi:hypothetical protein
MKIDIISGIMKLLKIREDRDIFQENIRILILYYKNYRI